MIGLDGLLADVKLQGFETNVSPGIYNFCSKAVFKQNIAVEQHYRIARRKVAAGGEALESFAGWSFGSFILDQLVRYMELTYAVDPV